MNSASSKSRPKPTPVKPRAKSLQPIYQRLKPLPISWEMIEPSSTIVRVPYHRSKDWRQTFLLASDRHWDNPKSDHEMQVRHLEEMVDRNAFLIENGDTFCAMQGKYDKRSSKTDIRPEHMTGNYLDSLVTTQAEFLKPYAKRIVLIGKGNHEESIQIRHETNLTDRLIHELNQAGGNVVPGGFGGFIRFVFFSECPSGPAAYQSVVLHYDHGYGGGGPVTRDMIQHQRRQVYLPDADIIISGHTHDQWTAWVSRLRVNQSGKISHDEVLHIKTPTYKEEYQSGHGGWHVATGKPPKPIGAYWLNFSFKQGRIVFDVERAV